MAMPEVPESALPTVSAVLTAAVLGQEPIDWRLSMGPLTVADGLVFGYTVWLLVELLDDITGPGAFGDAVTGILLRDDGQE
jgi:hypothetical protein